MKKITHPSFYHEQLYWNQGYTVVGLDEVGRGAFAGPLVAAGVMFRKGTPCKGNILEQIRDSKQLSPNIRQVLSLEVKKNCDFFSIAEVPVTVINRVGIGRANLIAFRKVISDLQKKLLRQNTFALVDGFHISYVKGLSLKNQKAIVKGDQVSISIAAASIIAKVYRDTLMKQLHETCKVYNFYQNKGYGTRYHRTMIKKHGITPLHRVAFCK